MAGRTLKEIQRDATQSNEHRTTFRLPNEAFQSLKILALVDGVSATERIRSIVIDWFQSYSSCRDACDSHQFGRSKSDVRKNGKRKDEHSTVFYLPNEIYSVLLDMSKEDDVSVCERIRAIVLHWLETHGPSFEAQGLNNVSNMVKSKRAMQRRANDHTMAIQVPDDVFQFLTALSIEDGIPAEERVRNILIDWFKEN